MKTIIGEYMILGDLGAGSFSKVKLGKNKLDQEVAIKIARPKTNPQAILTELKIGQRLTGHSHICQMLDSFYLGNEAHLVFERIEGRDLFGLLEETESGISEDLMRRLFAQIVQALGYAHKQGIVHRDIKPENILVEEKGDQFNAKIIDWGLGAFFEPKQQLSTHAGSVEYCAPEVLLGKQYDGIKADCWSLGVLLYVALTGLFPWAGKTNEQVISNIIKSNYFVPRNISKEAFDLIAKLLIVDPVLRLDTDEILAHPWLHQVNPGTQTSA